MEEKRAKVAAVHAKRAAKKQAVKPDAVAGGTRA